MIDTGAQDVPARRPVEGPYDEPLLACGGSDGCLGFGSQAKRCGVDLDRWLVLDEERHGVGSAQIGQPGGRPVRMTDVPATVDPRHPNQYGRRPAALATDETELDDLVGGGHRRNRRIRMSPPVRRVLAKSTRQVIRQAKTPSLTGVLAGAESVVMARPLDTDAPTGVKADGKGFRTPAERKYPAMP